MSKLARDLDGHMLRYDEGITESDKQFFRKSYPRISDVANMKINCSACKKSLPLKSTKNEAYKTNPVLKVTMCTSCYDRYVSNTSNSEKRWQNCFLKDFR